MGWGGARPGSGRKPSGVKPNPNRPRRPAATKLRANLPTIPAEPKVDVGPAIDPRAWAMMLPEIEEISKRYAINKERDARNSPFRLPDFPPAAMPPKDKYQTMAMDEGLGAASAWGTSAWLAGATIGGISGEGLLFLGYAYLSELAQRPEFRIISETIADDATRRWIDFDVTGDEKEQKEQEAKDPEGYAERMADPDERKKRVQAAGKTDKVKMLKDDQERLEVRDRFYEAARNDGFFGRSHLFVDLGTEDPAELRMPIGQGRSLLSESKIRRKSFKALQTIEPIWTYPLMYNSSNPLRADWYNPQSWFVMGQEIHCSRLQTFIGHPVPDLLKPAYSFGGLSLTQMAKPYVDIWLTTRQSVADLIHSFSVMVLMTDLSTMMQPGGAGPLLARIALFNMLRDNQGAFVVNKNTEDFKNVSASLAGLHELQAQAQEHMASVARIPLVKFTGIQPAGLNASSEGEIKVYDDTISAYQNRFMRRNLTHIVNFEQLSMWGEVDPEITIRFEQLRVMTDAEKGTKEKDDADRDQKYVDMGALHPGEVRKRIIDDPELPYAGLDPDDVPDLKEEEAEGLEPVGGRPQKPGGEGGEKPDNDQGGGAADEADGPFVFDEAPAFREEDHPRAPDGKFGKGSGHFSSASEKTGINAGKSFPFVRNTKSSKSFKTNQNFGQNIEPAGRYLSKEHPSAAGRALEPGWERGEVTFQNPMFVESGSDNYESPENWKARLSAAFGGKTGAALSKAIHDAGFDGVVTHDKYGVSEIVDLTARGPVAQPEPEREVPAWVKAMSTRTDTHMSEYEHVYLTPGFEGSRADEVAKKFKSPEEFKAVKDAVAAYKTSMGDNDAYTINQELRQGKVTPEVQKAIDNLDKAFDVVGQDMPRDMMVYRSIGNSRGEHAPFEVGQTVIDHGFTSTSAYKHFADDFGEKNANVTKRTRVNILVPKGARILAMADRGYQDEGEILLQHGTKFRVESVDQDGTVNLRMLP